MVILNETFTTAIYKEFKEYKYIKLAAFFVK